MDNHAFRALNEVARRFPGTIPRLNRFASAVASQRERVDWSYAHLRLRAARALRGDGVRVPREHAVAAVRAARAALERHAVSFPIELRFTRRRRRAALARPRPRQRVRRRARLPGHAVRAGVPRGRGGAERARRAPALGQALVPGPHAARSALPALGRLPAHPRASSTRAGASPTRGSATCWDERDEDAQHLRAGVRVRRRGPRRLPRAAWTASGPKIGASRIGCSVYELPPGQALCPYHYEGDEEWIIVLEGRAERPPPERDRRARAGRRGGVPGRPGGRAQGLQRVRPGDAGS